MTTRLDRFLHALDTKGYRQVHRTEDGMRVFRHGGGRWAILDCKRLVLHISTAELSVDGAEGPLLRIDTVNQVEAQIDDTNYVDATRTRDPLDATGDEHELR